MEKDIALRFVEKIQQAANPAQLLARVSEAVAKSTAKYIDEPIPFLYHPVFWSKEEIAELEVASATLTSILHKVVQEYLKNPDFRKQFNFNSLLEELILVDPGYQNPVPMARFDVFYHQGQRLKFCEFNADGSSGMNEDNVLAQIFLSTLPLKELAGHYSLRYFELLESWVEQCLGNYWEYNRKGVLPTVAIVDWEGASTIREFEAFQKAFGARGCKAIITDPRNLKYKNGKLYFNNLPIDLIYRRLVTHEIIQRQEEISDFITAYHQNAVCMVGPLRSQIIHDKIIFKVLQDREAHLLFTPLEVDFIKKHLPFTALFKKDAKVLELARLNKDAYVLKPQDLYGSRGVFVGREWSNKKWAEIIKVCWDKDYLLQEFVAPPEMLMLNSKLKLESFKQITGLYLYNGVMKGLYTRVGRNNVIATSKGGFVVPNLYYE